MRVLLKDEISDWLHIWMAASLLNVKGNKAIIKIVVLANQSKYVTVPGKRDHLGNFFKIELLLPQGRVGFELQNALHI